MHNEFVPSNMQTEILADYFEKIQWCVRPAAFVSTDEHIFPTLDMDEEEMPRTCVPTPRTSVPRPSVTSGPGYRNAVLDSPLSASLGRIDYSSYMKRPPSAAVKIAKTPSPVRKTNAAKAWLKRHKN